MAEEEKEEQGNEEEEGLRSYRVSTDEVAESIIESESYEAYLMGKPQEKVGVLAAYGPDKTKNSNISDVKKAMADLKGKSKAFQNKVNNSLSGLTPTKLLEGMFGGPLGKPNPISKTWGVFEKVLCWDGEIDFSLQDLIDALDFNFNFLRTWAICQRQGLNNPITGLMNSIKRLEGEVNALYNVGPRLLNNLKMNTRAFIRLSGLPVQLQRCMLQSSFLNTASKYKDLISLKDATDLLKALDNSICRSSPEGIGTTRNTFVEKAAMAPFLEGLTTYNRDTAFASIISIADNPNINNDIVTATLIEGYKDQPNMNTVQLLEILALTKAYGKTNAVTKDTSIKGLNTLLLNSPDGSDKLLENALEINAGTSTDTNVSNQLSGIDDRFIYIPSLKPEIVLTNMKDNYADTTKPKEDLEKIKKLLHDAMPEYKPEENVSSIAKSDTIMTLMDKNVGMTKGDKLIENFTDTNVSNLRVYKTKKNSDPYYQAYLVSETRKAVEASQAS